MEQYYPGFSCFLFTYYLYNYTYSFLVFQRTLRVPSCQKAVRIVDQRGETPKEHFAITAANGVNWYFKASANVHWNGLDKAFVCCGHRCKCKMIYSSTTVFLVGGVIAASSIAIENSEKETPSFDGSDGLGT